MKENYLPQGTLIKFSINPHGPLYGRISGVATHPQPVIGPGYIVELLENLPDYPFTHMQVFGAHLQVVDSSHIKWVIRYNDGDYDSDGGFPVKLLSDATLYESEDQANFISAHLMDNPVIIPIEEIK